MKYFKVKVSMKDYGNKVVRTFYALQSMSAEEFAVKVLTSFNAVFEHMFLFRKGDVSLVHPSWLEDECFDNKYYDYKTLTLYGIVSAFGNTFTLEYDTGEGWEFNVKVDEKEYTKEKDNNFILVNGKGYGIFEDSRYLLDLLFKNGNIKDALIELKKEWEDGFESDEDIEKYLPINANFGSDFTLENYLAPIDVEDMQDLIDETLYFFDDDEF